MRVLFVGHSFLSAYNQTKFVMMKRMDPALRIRIVVPTSMPERFGRLVCERHSGLSAEEVVPLGAWPVRSHMTYLHNPRRLATVLREFQPDVVHIVEEPQALVTVETISLLRRFAPRAAVTLFTWDNLLRKRRFPLDMLKRRLRTYSLRRTAMVVCGNERAAELLRAEGRFEGFTEVITQFGLDITEHAPGSEAELRLGLGLSGSIVVGYAGRLVPEKGLSLLIDALGRLRIHPWKLLLVGSGPLESEIRERWTAEFPGRIVLVPVVPKEQVAKYLRCMDIFVLPSLSTPSWMEQFGLALAQAMILGIASIGSSSGAIPEVLGPGGIVFEEGNTEQLARALEELLSSPARREQLGALGREFALKNYTQEVVAARYLAAFERVLSQSALSREQSRKAAQSGAATDEQLQQP